MLNVIKLFRPHMYTAAESVSLCLLKLDKLSVIIIRSMARCVLIVDVAHTFDLNMVPEAISKILKPMKSKVRADQFWLPQMVPGN